jgi:hypothetical protein
MERDVIRQTPDQPGLVMLGNASVKREDVKASDQTQLRDGVTLAKGNIKPVSADHGACCLPKPCRHSALL